MNEFVNQTYGYFIGSGATAYFALATALVVLALGYTGAPLILWTVAVGAALVGFGAPAWLLIAFAALAVVFNVKPIRRIVLSAPVMKVMKGVFPSISETERTALEAGVVWVEGDLFSGRPDFGKIMKEPYPELTPEEKAFMDGPVEELCKRVDEWQIWKEREIPEDVWAYMKKNKFLGMIIPKEYGGLGFSNLFHSEVIMKLASRSIPVTISAMVPNSLGPAELLNHYGTEAQKKRYLPRLAIGEEVPAFALTEPRAGSDAGAIQAEGVLFKGDDGKLKIRLNWNKRWITLAAISTTLGMAFRLRDPENLLGKGEDVGITCALIPTNLPGVVLGRRHDPLGVPFYNCPTQGKDVVVDAEEQIIGGVAGAGKGWGMLMESLGAGRGISLPSQATGGAKAATRVVSAHSAIRKQFGVAIGKFEGIEEPLARIGGDTYLLEALRRFTVGALDKGVKPPVVTAIAKYHSSEIGRRMVNDGMDIMGGAGISRGPRNLISNYYISAPISVTVEGANIMTRTLMIFGQGALRAHPYAYKQIKAVERNDLKAFDAAFWGHMGHIVRNGFRAVLLSVTRGRLAGSPVGGATSRYYRKLAWTSASFAILADIAMGSLGGALKMKEKITGRFADILSWMYIGTAVLRRYEAEGRRKEDLPIVHFVMQNALKEIQTAFDGIFANLPVPGLSWLFRGPIRIWSNLNPLSRGPSDKIGHQVCNLLLVPNEARDRLTSGIFVPKDPNEAMGRLERAFVIVSEAEGAERKIRKAIKKKRLPKKKVFQVMDEALEKGVITQAEYDNLVESENARWDAIQVDDFSEEEYLANKVSTPSSSPRIEPQVAMK